MFLSPPHFHHLPPTVIALSIETWAETASERTKLGRAFQVWSPTSVFCYSFPSSFSFAFLLCVSGTIFMFSSSMVYNVAVKQTFTPFSFYRQWSGSKCERYNCHAHSFAASDQWWLQAFWDCGTRGRGKLCWSWREGKACWTKVLWLILIALGIWQGKACKFIQFLIPSSTS